MAHPFEHPNQSFSYSQHQQQIPYQQQQQQQQQQQPMIAPPSASLLSSHYKPRKAKKGRKKNPPAGPAGIWFLSNNNKAGKKHKQKQGNAFNSPGHNNSNHGGNPPSPPSSPDDDDHEMTQSPSSTFIYSNPHKNRHAMSSCKAVAEKASKGNPAWTAMQCNQQWLVPDTIFASLPRAMSSLQRYRCLRPHVPPNYLLVPELTMSSQIPTLETTLPSEWWKFPLGQKLIVLVQSVSCHHDDIWTVELSDDTGASIQAWMQPSFVQMEKQQHADNATGPQYIKPGYVWCLEHVTMMLQQTLGSQDAGSSTTAVDDHAPENNNNNNNNKSQCRMLLISERNVTQVWTQESLDQIDKQTFLDWVEASGKRQRQWDEANDDAGSNHDSSALFDHHYNMGNSEGNMLDTARKNQTLNSDESSSEEEEDDEDRYRRQQHEQHYGRRSSSVVVVVSCTDKQHSNNTELDTMDNNMVVGGPIIQSLHPSSGSKTPPTPRNNIFFMSSQQQQQRPTSSQLHSQATNPSNNSRNSTDSFQSEKSAAENNTTSGDTNSLSVHLSQQQAQRPMNSSDLPGHPLSQPEWRPQQQQQHYNGKSANTVTPRHPPSGPHMPHPGMMVPPQQLGLHPMTNTVTPGMQSVSKSNKQQYTAQQQQLVYQSRPTPQRQERHPQQHPQRMITSQTTPRPQQQHPSQSAGNRRVSFSQLAAPEPSQMQTPRLEMFAHQPLSTSRPQNNKENQDRQENCVNSAPAIQEECLLGVSQLSATKGKAPSTEPGKAGPSGDQQSAPKGEHSLSKSTSLEENIKTPPKKRTKDKSKRKAKKAKYDESPLSQTTRPSSAALWTSSALLDGAGLLDLSSDDEEDHAPSMAAKGLVPPTSNKELVQATKEPTLAFGEETTATTLFVSQPIGSIFGGGATSIFQASSVPGMDLMLSDDDDDDS